MLDLFIRVVAGVLLVVLGLGVFGLLVLHAAMGLDDSPQEKSR